MASISNDKNGLRRILFFDQNGDRHAIRLGKVPMKVADAIKTKIEEILSHKASGCSWSNEVATWVGNLGDDLADKLASVGLIPRRIKSTLGAFLDAFLKKRENAKPNSYKNYKQGIGKLLDHFGREVDLRNLTPSMAEDWAIDLTEKFGHSPAYTGRLVKFARQFFKQAIREKLVADNPFEGIKAQAQVNESRKFFVTQEMARKVLEACPDAEWRLIFALARYGGLRCPSEVFGLKWADVDWAKGRMLVIAPKTEHHQGGGKRMVPIFPELRPYLEDAWELAKEGAVHVITFRGPGPNLRTQVLRIIDRAGLKAWPKPFQNLRASRETELVAMFPIHVVCSWIGNSERVAVKHYLQVTEEDFDKATTGGAQSGAPEAQKAARQIAAPSCTNDQNDDKPASGGDIVPVGAGYGNMVQDAGLRLSGVVDVLLTLLPHPRDSSTRVPDNRPSGLGMIPKGYLSGTVDVLIDRVGPFAYDRYSYSKERCSMFQKYAVMVASLALFAWAGAERVDARGGGGGGRGGGGGHAGGGAHVGGGAAHVGAGAVHVGAGGAHYGGGGFAGGYARGGYGFGSYGRGGYGFYGYPFSLGYGLGYGYPYIYGGYGYGYSGYFADGGYVAPYNSGYAYPPGGYGPSLYAPSLYGPLQAPLPDDGTGTYPYNGDPSTFPPLQSPDNPAPTGLRVSRPTSTSFAAYGEEPQATKTATAAARTTPEPAPTMQPRAIRVVYPAYGEQPAQTSRDH